MLFVLLVYYLYHVHFLFVFFVGILFVLSCLYIITYVSRFVCLLLFVQTKRDTGIYDYVCATVLQPSHSLPPTRLTQLECLSPVSV